MKIQAKCANCNQRIEWQARPAGDVSRCPGYWFSESTDSVCPATSFGHERAPVPGEEYARGRREALELLASAFKKVLQPETLAAIKWAVDPLGQFLEVLRKE